MVQLLVSLVAAGVVACLAGEPPAPTAPGKGKRLDLIVVSVITDASRVRVGETIRAAVVLDVAKDWHVYWPGQNDSGTPVGITLKLPEGWEVPSVEAPTPTRHVAAGGLLDYVLDGKVLYTFEVPVPVSVRPGTTVPITADVSYLVCNDQQCLPGRASATIGVAVTKDERVTTEASASLITAAAEKQPRKTGWKDVFGASVQGFVLTLKSGDPSVTSMTFYPRAMSAALADPIRCGTVKGNELTLRFENMKKTIEGVVEVVGGASAGSYSFSYHAAHEAVPVPPVQPAKKAEPTSPAPPEKPVEPKKPRKKPV